jgi:hypothetical protein
MHLLTIDHAQRTEEERVRLVRSLHKRPLSPQLFQSLSRACLGNFKMMMVF